MYVDLVSISLYKKVVLETYVHVYNYYIGKSIWLESSPPDRSSDSTFPPSKWVPVQPGKMLI